MEAVSLEPELPSGRLGGVDFGTKRIGVAISDPQKTIASPLAQYERRGESEDARWFVSLAHREEITAWVVGLPVHASGDESPKSVEARKFGIWLQKVTERPVFFFDERYSTVEADRFLADANFSRKRRKERRDMLAAQVILSAFLESQDRSGPTPPLDDS